VSRSEPSPKWFLGELRQGAHRWCKEETRSGGDAKTVSEGNQ
jgi:hypothetical protein